MTGDANVPFSTTKGNHDNDVYSTHELISKWEQKHFPRHSYTQIAPPGVGSGSGPGEAGTGSDNYWLPIYARAPDAVHNERPALLLWFLDSRSGKTTLAFNNTEVDDWIHPSVGTWIEAEVKRMQKDWSGAMPPSLIFTHVPPHASAASQQDAPYAPLVGGVSNETSANFTSEGRRYPGLNDDYGFQGQAAEGDRTYAGQDLVAINALLGGSAGKARIHGIVSGHQHGNDWVSRRMRSVW